MRKWPVFLLSLLTAALCSGCAFAAQEISGSETPHYTAAFSDESEAVTIREATLVQKYFSRDIERSALDTEKSDVDADGEVTVEDALLIQLYLAEYIDGIEPADTAKPLTIGAKAMTLGLGETFNLSASYGEGDSALSYLSEDPAVAQVDAAGNVAALSVGATKITVVSKNGQLATCQVKVKKAPTAVSLDQTELVLRFGEQVNLNSSLPAGEASFGTVFTSSDPSVAEVTSSGGLVTAMKAGEAVITVKTYNGKTASCRVTVISVPPMPEVTNPSTAMLGVGEIYPLGETLESGLPVAPAVFVSSNPEVAVVDAQTGDIVALSVGYATISVTVPVDEAASGEEAAQSAEKTNVCYVSVRKAPTAVTFTNQNVKMLTGESVPFYLRPAKNDEAVFGASFVSSDSSICAVTPAGVVTAVKPGTATVTATAYNGMQASVTVTVLDNADAEVKTTTADVRLLRDASWKASPIAVIPKGASVKAFDTSADGRWLKVQYGEHCGWIYNKAVGVKKNFKDVTVETLPAAADDYIFDRNADIRNMYEDIQYAMDYRTCDEEPMEKMVAYILKYRRGACYQRAALMCYVLDRMGYDTIYVSGTIPMYDDTIHRWALVKTADGWRHIDATPVWEPDYCLVTDSEMDVFVWDTDAYPAAE